MLHQPQQINDCVTNCLKTLGEVNRKKGLVSPVRTDQRKIQEDRAASDYRIRSIVFPLFGVGQGGGDLVDVARIMAEAIREFFLDERNSEIVAALEDIYLSVFFEEDIAEVRGAIESVLGAGVLATG